MRLVVLLIVPGVVLLGDFAGVFTGALDHPSIVSTCTVVNGVPLYPGIGREHIVLGSPPEPHHSRNSIRWILERQCLIREAVTDDWVDHAFKVANSERNRIAVRKMNADQLKDHVYIPAFAKQLSATHRALLEKGMPCPTLLTWSLNDPVGDVSNGRLLVEMYQQKQPQTEVRYFNGTGHYPLRENPRALALMLKHYLAAFA